MASFSAFLEVGGSRYPLTYYDLYIHQQTDSLGRPASPTLGGTITVELHSPGQNDTVLTEWMLSPTRQHDGFVHLYRDDTKAKLKTISFFNAYAVGMGEHFSASGSGPMLTQLVISPQRVAVGGIVHDNNWPVESHGAGVTFVNQTTKSPKLDQTIAVSQTPNISPASVPQLVTASATMPPGPASQSTCPPAVQARLQAEVEQRCKTGTKTSCNKTDSCEVLTSKMDSINSCIQARTKINMQCYKGGNPGHKTAIQYQINSLVICQGIFFPKCMNPPNPVPVPRSVPAPETNDDFMRRMEQITGLSGAALILYLIISEGSRLFPPRNLVPVP